MILTKEEAKHRKDMMYMGFTMVNFFSEHGIQYKYEYVKRHKVVSSELYLLVNEVENEVL